MINHAILLSVYGVGGLAFFLYSVFVWGSNGLRWTAKAVFSIACLIAANQLWLIFFEEWGHR